MYLFPQCITIWTDAIVTKSKDHRVAVLPAMHHRRVVMQLSAVPHGNTAQSVTVQMPLGKRVTVGVTIECAENSFYIS